MLVDKTNRFIEEVNEVKNLCMRQMALNMEYMNDEAFVLLQRTIKLMNTSTEVIKEQAKVVESIDKKLDKLLARKES